MTLKKVLAISYLLLTTIAWAHTVDSIPNPTKRNSYIANPDGVIKPDIEKIIAERLQNIKNTSSNQVAIVIVKTIDDQVPKDFAVKLFDKWGIGEKGKDNGLLILLVMDQRRIEFEVGYGLEGIITDYRSNDIIQNYMLPEMKSARVDQAINFALDQIQEIFQNPGQLSDIQMTEELERNFPVQSSQENFPMMFDFIMEIFGLAIGLIILISNTRYLTGPQKLLAAIGLGVLFLTFFISIFTLVYVAANIIWLIKVNLQRRVHLIDFLFSKNSTNPLKTWEKIIFALSWITTVGIRKYLSIKQNQTVTKMDLENFKFVSDAQEEQYLTAAQLKEEELGSVEHEVYFNSVNCTNKIESKVLPFSKYQECKGCKAITSELTKSHTKSSPTYASTGTGINFYECRSCQVSFEVEFTIPRLTRSSSGNGISSSRSSSSSSSSSFGGGRSGGGGAGGSW